jgi:hypothetical protein
MNRREIEKGHLEVVLTEDGEWWWGFEEFQQGQQRSGAVEQTNDM